MATVTRDRPEVVAAVIDELQNPVGYIGQEFFPRVVVQQSSGDMAYKVLDAPADETTRGSETAAITSRALADGEFSYSCSEHLDSVKIREANEKIWGGVEVVDQVGVAAAGETVLRGFEKGAADKILTTAAYNAATYLRDGLAMYGLNAAAIDIARYEGHTVLAGGTTFFANLVLSNDVSERMIAFLGASGLTADLVGKTLKNKPEIIAKILGMFSPVDQILVGDDAFWGARGCDAGILARVPRPEQMSDPAKAIRTLSSRPIFGVAPWMYPDPTDSRIFFRCRSYFDEGNNCDTYKASGYYDQKILNSGACKIVRFSSPLVSTTTTAAG